MIEEWEIVLRICQRRDCTEVARWELWTLYTYHYFCDEHRLPDSEIASDWEQRWRPEGVLDSGGLFAIREH